jgi:membrane protease YdiL (CAAX protease family)
VPALGATFYIVLGKYAWELGDDLAHRLAAVWCFAAAAISVVTVAHPVIDRIAIRMFRTGPVGRTRRLTARLVVLALLLPVPMQALMPEILDAMKDSAQPLADTSALVTQLLGEVAVALAGVGWLARRRWPETAERLGLGAVRPSHAGIILAGIVAAVAINAGMEALQKVALPELWRQDQEVTAMIATKMAVWTALVLGLSAGLGEEIVLRGALQPRLGVVLTSVVFACGHVQYSWFGMLTIALLGIMLGLVRLRTNTTVAIIVHGLYDVFAVLSATR